MIQRAYFCFLICWLTVFIALDASAYHMEYVPYRKGKLYGISNRKGEMVIQPEYIAMWIDEPFIFGANGGKVTVFNRKCQVVGSYDGSLRSMTNHFFIVSDPNRAETLYDSAGNKAAANPSGHIYPLYEDGLYIINQNRGSKNAYIILNTKGERLNKELLNEKPEIFGGRVSFPEGSNIITVDNYNHKWEARLPDNAEYVIKYGYIIFHDGNGYGVYTTNGRLIVPQQKEYVIFFPDRCMNDRKPTDFFNIVYAADTAPESKNIIRQDNAAPVRKGNGVMEPPPGIEYHVPADPYPGGLRGIMDTNGRIIARPAYRLTSRLFKDFYITCGSEDNATPRKVLDKDGKDVFGFEVFIQPCISTNLAIAFREVNHGFVYGIINDQCQWAAPMKYAYIYYRPEYGAFDISDVKPTQGMSSKFGLLSKDGQEVFPMKYHSIRYIGHGVFELFDGRNAWLADSAGRRIGEADIRLYNEVGTNYLLVQKNNKWRLMDYKGNYINKLMYDSVARNNPTNSNIYRRAGKYYIITPNGKEIPANRYISMSPYENGVSIVTAKDGKMGLMNKEGELILPCNYHLSNHFTNGFILSNCDNGKAGIMDSLGKALLPCKYRYVEQNSLNFKIEDGLLQVINESHRDYVGIDGREYFEE
jgi:hypothetical protein